jgi:hypothetical protein
VTAHLLIEEPKISEGWYVNEIDGDAVKYVVVVTNDPWIAQCVKLFGYIVFMLLPIHTVVVSETKYSFTHQISKQCRLYVILFMPID